MRLRWLSASPRLMDLPGVTASVGPDRAHNALRVCWVKHVLSRVVTNDARPCDRQLSSSDAIHISSAAGNVDVNVSLFVAASGSILGVDITGVTFHGQQSSGYSHAQRIKVLNLGDPGTTVNWAADVPYGDTLVSPSPASGTATPVSPGTLTLTPSATAVSLAAGGYYALVRISDAQSLNSPQYVVVVLDQRSGSAPASPDPSPGGLFFTAAAGGSSPAQQVNINASATSPFQASTSTTDGASWLSASPTLRECRR